MENGVMMRISSFIVKKRNAFLILFIISCIYSITMINKVEVIDDLTKYLSEDTQTRQGLDIMDREFETFGSAKVLITNITYDRALELKQDILGVKGISGVKFYEYDKEEYQDESLSDYYKDAGALYTISFEEAEKSALSLQAIKNVRDIVSEYDSYVYTQVDRDDSKALKNDMKLILLMVGVVIIGVLLFTSQTYMEILIYIIVFASAAILNMGTNYWFGNISFVTNAVAVVLQLAMAIDYAIILFHRFMEEREYKNTVDAMTIALSKAITEISASSLTTISGMLALMLMQFGIGLDMGRVLTKAIIFSMISVFFLMPALIIIFSKYIEKTKHKSFVPEINIWGKFIIKTCHIILPLFVILVGFAYILSGKTNFIYDVNSIDTSKKTEYLESKEKIESIFELDNPMAIIIPKGDYEKEALLAKDLEKIPEVSSVISLANIEVGDDREYTLVDELNPIEFSKISKKDLNTIRILYRLYAIDNNQYSGMIKGIDNYRVKLIDLIDFIYEQKQSGGIDFEDDVSETIDEIYKNVSTARRQLEGEEYSRMIFLFKGKVEGEYTFKTLDRVNSLVKEYYPNDFYVVGDSTSNYDLSNSFKTDNIKISILTALFVGIILLFSFQSLGIPLMLLLTIQGSIWFNFSIPYLAKEPMFFLSYLIVSSIQMGCTIDYAIVITSRYVELRKVESDKKTAIIKSLNGAFPTILTSGTILTCAGFVIGFFTNNPTISSLGITLGKGTMISIFLVMTVLPQILLVLDKVIDKTDFTKIKNEEV